MPGPGQVAAAAAVAVFAALTTHAWAEGFPRGHRDALGPNFEAAPQLRDGVRHRPSRRATESLERLLRWNQIAVDASGLDHTPVQPGETRVFGEQLGPGRSSRAMAIVHIAMFDAVNAIGGGYRSYTGLRPAPDDASMDAAIAQAAHDTLVAMFPSQAASFDQLLAEDLHEMQDRRTRASARASRSAAVRRRRSSRSGRKTVRSIPSRGSASTSSRARSRANGARIR